MRETQLTNFKKKLIIRPLVFSDQKDNYGKMEYVNPNYIDKDKPPITAQDVKEMKTYLTTIMKSKDWYYRGKRRIWRAFARKGLEQKPKDEKPEGEFKHGSITIRYNQVSKRSLKGAMKKCEQALKSNRNNPELTKKLAELKEELTILYKEKKISADISLTALVRTHTNRLTELITKLHLTPDSDKLTKYIPSKLREIMPNLKNNNSSSVSEYSWETVTAPTSEKLLEICKNYEKHCAELMKAMQEIYEEYDRKKQMTLTTQNATIETIIAINKYNSKQENVRNQFTANQKILGQSLDKLDELITNSKEIVSKLSPFATKLYESAQKAKIQGMTSVYTKLSDKLNGMTSNLKSQISEIAKKKHQIQTTLLGMDGLIHGKKESLPESSWSNILEKVEIFNEITQECCEILTARGLFHDENDVKTRFQYAADTLEKLENDLRASVKKDSLEQIKNNIMNIDIQALTNYTIATKGSLSEVETMTKELSNTYNESKFTIDEASKTLLGKLILFKEKHVVGLEMMKSLANMAQSLSSTISRI